MSPSKKGGGEVTPLAPASSPAAAGSCATPLSGTVPRIAHGDVVPVHSFVGIGHARSLEEGVDRNESGWIKSRIGDQVTLQRGFDITKVDQRAGVVPVVSSGGISSWHDTVAVKGPGVVLGRKGVVGSVYYVEQDYWPHDTSLWVKDFKGNLPKYVYYFFKNLTPRIVVLDVGSANPTLNRNHVHPMEIEWPSLPIQKSIAQILGTLDDKIELNRRINQTLEEMAQALFKSWFVDFDPVRAKAAVYAAADDSADAAEQQAEWAAMRVISGKTQDELDAMRQSQPDAYADLARTASLFPSRLVESELGLIPEGWEVKSLSSLIQLTGGGTPKRSEDKFWGGNIPWFSIRDLPARGDVFVTDTVEKITELGLQKSSTKLLRKGTTIITARGTVGELALIATPMCMNQSCYGLTGIDGIGDFYNYFNIKQSVLSLQQNVHGAVFDTITTSTFETCFVAFAGMAVNKRFDDTVASVLCLIEKNVRQNQKMSSLRDSLLPKLLSGELEIPDELLAEVNP